MYIVSRFVNSMRSAVWECYTKEEAHKLYSQEVIMFSRLGFEVNEHTDTAWIFQPDTHKLVGLVSKRKED